MGGIIDLTHAKLDLQTRRFSRKLLVLFGA